MIKDFTDLIAWQKSHKLVLDLYQITSNFPRSELFGLSSQLRRAIISVSSNLAEGFGRRSVKEKIRFNYIALGSIAEVQNQLLVARDLKYISLEECQDLFIKSTEIAKIINGINNYLRNNKL